MMRVMSSPIDADTNPGATTPPTSITSRQENWDVERQRLLLQALTTEHFTLQTSPEQPPSPTATGAPRCS